MNSQKNKALHSIDFQDGSELLQHEKARIEKASGWKIHLSIDPKDVKRGRNIIEGILGNQVMIAKIASDGQANKCSDPSNPEAGKMITVYDMRGTDLESIVRNIEKYFREVSIDTGPPVRHGQPLAGSRYIYIEHNDKAQAIDKERLEASQQYNPLNLEHPLGNVSVNPEGDFASLRDLPFNVLKIASAGLWQKAQIEGGDQVVRVPVSGPGQYRTEELRAALKGAGFENPEDRYSERLGHTIRLNGNDVKRLCQLNQLVIASACSDAKVMSGGGLAFPIANLGLEHKRALSVALTLFNINISADSRTKSLLVSKDDAQKIKTLAEEVGFRFEHLESQSAQKPVNPTRFSMR